MCSGAPIDDSKDQSYVLYTLGQPELAKTLFPVGDCPSHGSARWRAR